MNSSAKPQTCPSTWLLFVEGSQPLCYPYSPLWGASFRAPSAYPGTKAQLATLYSQGQWAREARFAEYAALAVSSQPCPLLILPAHVTSDSVLCHFVLQILPAESKTPPIPSGFHPRSSTYLVMSPPHSPSTAAPASLNNLAALSTRTSHPSSTFQRCRPQSPFLPVP